MNSEKPKKRGIPRECEIALALIGLAVTAPVLTIAAVLIVLNSRGPVFFRQKRVGLHGKEFTLIKLRTMRTDRTGAKITAANDARVTSVGKILRKTKVDELPELWNVLGGEMSFVGPRPEVAEFVDLDEPAWREILTHRPGITDPVTLRLRNEEHLLAQVVDKDKYYREIVQPYKLRGYLKFVRDKSWKTDIRISCRTLKAVLMPKTAKTPTLDEMRWSLAD